MEFQIETYKIDILATKINNNRSSSWNTSYLTCFNTRELWQKAILFATKQANQTKWQFEGQICWNLIWMETVESTEHKHFCFMIVHGLRFCYSIQKWTNGISDRTYSLMAHNHWNSRSVGPVLERTETMGIFVVCILWGIFWLAVNWSSNMYIGNIVNMYTNPFNYSLTGSLYCYIFRNSNCYLMQTDNKYFEFVIYLIVVFDESFFVVLAFFNFRRFLA